jgi:hypothetical protein
LAFRRARSIGGTCQHGAIAVVAAIWWALRLQYSAQVQACLSVDLGTPSLPGIGLVDVYSPI